MANGNDAGDIIAGTHLFCAASPGLRPGTELTGGEFGRRELTRPVLRSAMVSGEELKSFFDLGPFSPDTLDLTRPRRVSVPEPAAAVRVLAEFAWEVVRLREYPHRPSRLDCLFLWQREEDARDWFSQRTWPSGLYEVEVAPPRSRVFIADMGLVQFSAEDGSALALMERARKYWAKDGRDSRNPKVLLEGTVVVQRECVMP